MRMCVREFQCHWHGERIHLVGGSGSASITIRSLDEEAKTRLRVRAAEHHRSMEEEARLILRDAVGPQEPPPESRERYSREGNSRSTPPGGAIRVRWSARGFGWREDRTVT